MRTVLDRCQGKVKSGNDKRDGPRSQSLWQLRVGVQLVADRFGQRLGHMAPTRERRPLFQSKLRHQGIDCIFELATWHALYLATMDPWSL